MAAQRRIDLVLDSVRRLLRVGATANLLNLLQKQHPADLAQVFKELADRDRDASFNLLADRHGRLAMEALSELGPEVGASLLATRSAEDIARLAQEIPSDDAAALIDNLPEELSAAVLDLMRPKESGVVENLLEYAERTAGRIMNPQVFALAEDLTVGEAITELQSNREVEMVFYLYVVDDRRHLVGVASLRRLLLVSPETPLKRIMSSDLISARVDMDQEEVARQVAAYNLLAIPVVDEENKLVGSHHRRRRHRRHQGRGHRGHLPPGRRGRRRAGVHARAGVAPQAAAVAGRQPGHRLPGGGRRRAVRGHDRASSRCWPSSCRSSPGWAATPAPRRSRWSSAGSRSASSPGATPGKRCIKEALVGIGNGVVLGFCAALVVWATRGNPVLGRRAGLGDGHQHVRRRGGRDAGPARACAR